jgi:RNA recognition motif-containing protein
MEPVVALDPKDPNYEDEEEPVEEPASTAEVEEKKPTFGIRIRNVVEAVDKEKLRTVCSPFGTVVKAYFARRGPRGKSRETAFVYFDNEASVERAIQQLNDKDLEGKQLRVEIAPPRPTRAARRARDAEREAKEDRQPWDESKKLDSQGKELCLNFRNSQDCMYGQDCKYSHEPGEPIGYPPRNRGRKAKQAESTDEVKVAQEAAKARKPRIRKPKLCRNWSDGGSCEYADECRFRHGEDDQRAIVQRKAPKEEDDTSTADAPKPNRGRSRGGRGGRSRGRVRGRRGAPPATQDATS